LSDQDRWRRTEPPPGRASEPRDLKFNPLATGIAVFTAIAIPVFVVGYTRRSGPNDVIIAAGIVVGLIVGIGVGVWVAHRGGRIWKGPL
jgi:uncharacterized membrane protein YfcA